ncbi:unnamed protein product, partial [Amoebophrya sp. A25]
MIYYYLRDGSVRKAVEVAQDQRELGLWRATALWCEGCSGAVSREREAIREAEAVAEMGGRDYLFAANAAASYFHERAQYPDMECVRKFQDRAMQEQQGASEDAKVTCGFFFLFVGERDRARQIADTLSRNRVTATFLAWTRYEEAVADSRRQGSAGATAVGKEALRECTALLDEFVIGEQGRELRISQLDGLMLKAKLMELSKNWAAAVEFLNQAIVYFPWYQPAIAERGRVQMASGDWDQALETCARLEEQAGGPTVDSLKIQLLHLVTRGGTGGGGSVVETTVSKLEQLLRILAQREPFNGRMLMENVQLFSRLAGRNPRILRVTHHAMQTFVENLQTGQKETSAYVTELGQQFLLVEDYKRAGEAFQKASSRNDADLNALLGLIQCRIAEGHVDDAAEQLEFLRETQASFGRSSRSSYLGALVAQGRKQATALQLLNEALTVHISDFRTSIGYEFYARLDADYMMCISNEYIASANVSAGTSSKKGGSQVTRALQVLETLSKFLPGSLSVQIALAKGKLTSGAVD